MGHPKRHRLPDEAVTARSCVSQCNAAIEKAPAPSSRLGKRRGSKARSASHELSASRCAESRSAGGGGAPNQSGFRPPSFSAKLSLQRCIAARRKRK